FPQRQGYVRLQRLDAVQARQSSDWWQRTERIQRMIPNGYPAKASKWKRSKFQSLLQAADKPIGRCRLDVTAKLRAVGLHQPVGMALVPAEPSANEQALLTHWYIPTGHHVTGDAADVAAVTQDRPGVAKANDGKGQEAQAGPQPQQGTQGQ